MEVSDHSIYDVDKSVARIDEILSASSDNFDDRKYVPSRSSLSYTNGYYVNVTALFIDIVGSSNMTDQHTRPVLAKTYRSFISECTAIMQSNEKCEEINIHGDCVWGVFYTPFQSDINGVIHIAAQLNSLIKILNYKLRKKGYSPIKVGIGIDYGRALMVKAGYAGSGINDVIWMGDVVNSACHLSGIAGRENRKTIIVSDCFYDNLNDKNKSFFTPISAYSWNKNYEGDIINIYMQNWYEDHCV